ncbi:MAG TPA: hypothetical protein VFU14_08055 [Acidimicrobiales bacterium]|nr:hypothetical protein [Acidimicrobiales bacterium]
MPATFPPPPDVLEVVYRVERVATGVVDTEHRLVRAPFEVRIETHRAEPDAVDPDADPTLLDIAVLGGVETGPVGQDRVLVVVPPTPALRGAHLGTDLAAAEQAGVLVPLGFGRELAGRACTELRTGAPIDGGLLRAPTDDDRSDVCVDDAGIVLREEVTAGGEVVERRTAVSVDADLDLDDADLDEAFAPLGYRIPEADGGGRVRLVTPDSRPPDVAHHELAAPPAGTELLGRFGVLTDSVPGPDAAGSVGAVISMVDVHVGGGEVVVVENGAAVAGGPVLGRGDVPVPLPFAPEATAVFLTTGVEIRAPLETGRFVRITSTLPLADTVSLAGSMRLLDGPGAVVPADDEPDVTGRFAPAR